MEAIYGLWSEENFGWNAQDLGLAFLAIGGGGLFAQLFLIGPLAARYGEARVIVIGLVLLALSMLLQPIIRLPISGVLLMGLLMASNAVGRIVAPPLFGLAYDHAGHDSPWYLGAVLIGLVVIVALQAVRLSPHTRAATVLP
jgi:predicted MFS family arabinose efflux permease